jgi:hypothetical protein
LVLLRAAMLVAVVASGSKVAQLIRAAVPQRLLMFDRSSCQAAFREWAVAITAFVTLELYQVTTHQYSI